MIRGTTAQFKFKLPCPKSELTSITIKFWQSNNPHNRLPIMKSLNNCGGSDELPELSVSLSAEETARFSDKYKAKIQLRGAYNGHIFGSKTILRTVYPMPDDIIGNDPTFPAEDDEWIILDGQEIVPQGGEVDE